MTSKEALSMLKKAIENVKPYYIRIDAIPNSRIKKVQVERCFAYELYHQWSMHLNAYNETCSNDAHMILNGEINKNLDLNLRVYPDIVLHGGQGDYNNQVLVCEIKRIDRSYPREKTIHKDLMKLAKLLNLKLDQYGYSIDCQYQTAAFVVANINQNDLKNRIKNALNHNANEWTPTPSEASKIYCFSVEVSDIDKGSVKVECFTLNELIG